MIRDRREESDPPIRPAGPEGGNREPIYDVKLPPERILRRWERDILPLLVESEGESLWDAAGQEARRRA
jgi:hypothetical protein